MDELSAALVRTEGGYAFTGGEYLAEKELWAMLVDEGGSPWCGGRANPPMCPTATPLPMWPPLPAGI